jgi:hypothetical protein
VLLVVVELRLVELMVVELVGMVVQHLMHMDYLLKKSHENDLILK